MMIWSGSVRLPVARPSQHFASASDRYWIKGSHGLDPMIAPLKNTFAARAGYPTTLLVVPDASIDPRFADHLQVVCEGGVRFYAGMPVKLTDDTLIGTISILDSVPRPASLSEDEQQALAALARAIATHLELRRALDALATAQQAALRAARLTAGVRCQRRWRMSLASHSVPAPITSACCQLQRQAHRFRQS